MNVEMLLHECDDAAALLAVFLSRADVRSASSFSKSVCVSSLRRNFLRAARMQLPPASSEYIVKFLNNLSPHARDAISFVDISGGKALVEQVLQNLSSVTRLRIRGCIGEWRYPFVLSSSVFQSSTRGAALENLTLLDLSNAEVVEISALLRGAKQLKSLNLSGNADLEDFSPLEALEKLEYLNLQGTVVSSIKFLSKTPRIAELNLNATRNLVDLHPISCLTQLRAVYLSRKQIATLTPLLASAATLEHLQVMWTQFDEAMIDEWDFLFSKLSNLQHLNLLGVKKLISLTPVAQLTKLTYLNVQACPVDVLAPLRALENLETLVLGWTNAYDFSALKSLTELKRLDAQGKQLKSIEFLTELEYFKGFGTLPRLPKTGRLQEVSFCFSDDNFTFRLAGVKQHLRALSLSGKFNLEEVVQTVPNLRQLELFITDPMNLAAVGKLMQLRKLTIRFSRTSTIQGPQGFSFLGSLVRLRQLWLFKCEIADLSPLRSLKWLKILYIGSRALEDISPLKHLSELEKVHLGATTVSSVECLQHLRNLQSVVLPRCADCSCLVVQYGKQLVNLKEVLHPAQNCIWTRHEEFCGN